MKCEKCFSKINYSEIYTDWYFCSNCGKDFEMPEEIMETLKTEKSKECMRLAAESHWLCKVFQDEKLEKCEKKEILRSIIRDQKIKNRRKNGQTH